MPDPTPLDDTFGWLYIGTVLAMALWGVTCIQTWWYFDNYPKDNKWLKLTVFTTFLLDTLHQALITYAIYIYVIQNFGDTTFAVSVDWSLYIEIVVNALTAWVVQSFFTYRIWTLRKNIPITVIVYLFVLANLGSSLAFVAQGMSQNLDTFAKFTKLKNLSMMVAFLSASKTGFSWSNHIINRLMLFSINTGILTAACACASLLFILALPNTLVYFGFYLTIGRLYTNSLLATLNARNLIRNQRGRSEPSQYDTTSNNMALQDRGKSRGQTSVSHGITVQIETIKNYSGDDAVGPAKDKDFEAL
ncbi:hypothetical protein V5O48_005362 [Marasmius crinis-equi]|uniref:DUF6534 domain-containing protein n=1 Tax=Marasmius crinis-equi TaxID=585013 RepID=A0ABR3FMI2_9AGAR